MINNPKTEKKAIHTAAKYAEQYDEKIVEIIPRYWDLLDSSVIGIPYETNKDITVMELGFGSGNLTLKILQEFPNSKIYGIDYSPFMRDKAVTKLQQNKISGHRFSPIVADITEYNYDKFCGNLDLIIGTLIFHDLTKKERDAFFAAASKMLKNEAVIIIGDVVGLDRGDYLKMPSKMWAKKLSKHLTSEEILALFNQPEMAEMLNADSIDDHHKSLSRYNLDYEFNVEYKNSEFAVIVSKKRAK